MWTLIIWSLLCTAADTDCKTGDYLVMEETHTHIRLCDEAGEFWLKPARSTNRYACVWTEEAERLGL